MKMPTIACTLPRQCVTDAWLAHSAIADRLAEIDALAATVDRATCADDFTDDQLAALFRIVRRCANESAGALESVEALCLTLRVQAEGGEP